MAIFFGPPQHVVTLGETIEFHGQQTEKWIDKIRDSISVEDLYEQLAEEAAELAQAANKLARIKRGTNPSPKTEDEAMNDLLEEYTDVMLVAHDILKLKPVELTRKYKLYRWAHRIDDRG